MYEKLDAHLVSSSASANDAMFKLDKLGSSPILFVFSEDNKLVGSITDGDIRRGILAGKNLEDSILEFVQPDPIYLIKNKQDVPQIRDYRSRNFIILPVVNESHQIVDIVDLRELKSYLPLDAVIMAGGRGTRLSPLTDNLPKSLLPIGTKPIIERNIEELASYGIDDIWISLGYMGDQIREYLATSNQYKVNLNYIEEPLPLGSAGALSLLEDLDNEYVLLLNSSVLTNLNFEDFFVDFVDQDADFSVLSIPYSVDIPYAVLETNNNEVKNFKEKPTYTYYSNGGVYLMKKEALDYVPKNLPFDATDLMNALIRDDKKVITFPFSNYWLDIGNPNDYEKAQRDIKQILH